MPGTTLENVVDFFRRFGFFDVLLPFLLVFTVVFAILEKSRILGEVKIGDETHPQKNLDAMVAFVVALLVVVATKVVGVINNALPKVALLIVVALSFLLLIGMFIAPGGLFEAIEKVKGLKTTLIVSSLILVILIFLGTLETKSGDSWLNYILKYTFQNWDSAIVGSVLIFIVFIGVILFVVNGSKEKSEGKKSSS